MSVGAATVLTMTEELSDETLLWSYALNCLMYEEDPGPATLNIGSVQEPKIVPRSEALRGLYSRLYIEKVDADETRLAAALDRCRQGLAECPEGEVKPAWACAADLCEQALATVRAAGINDESERVRFLAGLKHANASDVLGSIPGVVEDSAR